MEEIKSVNEVETKKEEEKIAWYAVSTMPGRERKVKESLESRAVTMGQSDVFHKVILVEQPEIEIKRNELNELLKQTNRTPEMDDRIIDLDDFIERSLDGESALSKAQKRRLMDNRFDEVLALLHKVLEEC